MLLPSEVYLVRNSYAMVYFMIYGTKGGDVGNHFENSSLVHVSEKPSVSRGNTMKRRPRSVMFVKNDTV